MTETVLTVRDLVKHFPVTKGAVLRRTTGWVKAVDGVGFTLARGETLGIVGESGCGKSTLARLLTALERPTSGEVIVLGRSLGQLRGRELRAARRDIQLVFQDPYSSLDPRMTVAETVREPFEVHPGLVPPGKRDGAVHALLEAVGLSSVHGERRPHELSGGQRQRVGLARALALRPAVLVLDEPTSALDVSVQAQIVNLLQQLQEEFRLGYVFISHDLGVVQHIADRVAVMYLGKVVEIGSHSDIADSPAHPYTQALLSAAPLADPALRGTREEIGLEGEPPSPINPPQGCPFHPRCHLADADCVRQAPVLRPKAGAGHLVSCHKA